jgi:hypothetical protein
LAITATTHAPKGNSPNKTLKAQEPLEANKPILIPNKVAHQMEEAAKASHTSKQPKQGRATQRYQPNLKTKTNSIYRKVKHKIMSKV